MQQFMVFLIAGVSFGAAYALLALSINVIYSSSNILNFAQGELMMVGGMLLWAFGDKLGIPYIWTVLLVVLTCGALCVLSYYAIVLPMLRRQSSLIAIVIGTLGFSIILRIAAQFVFGKVGQPVSAPFGSKPVDILGTPVAPQAIVIVGSTAIVLAGLWWVYSRTTLGLILRAVAFEPTGSELVGINVTLTMATSFLLGGALAGLAGLLVAPLSYASPFVGLDYAIAGFAGAVIGGLGSWPGAIIGGIAVGLSRTLFAGYVSANWAAMATFILIILVLVVRPSGLFPERAVAR